MVKIYNRMFYSQKNNFGLIVNLDDKFSATGKLYLDDGVSQGKLDVDNCVLIKRLESSLNICLNYNSLFILIILTCTQ